MNAAFPTYVCRESAAHCAHVAGIERLAVERLAGLAGLDAGAASHHAGINARLPCES